MTLKKESVKNIEFLIDVCRKLQNVEEIGIEVKLYQSYTKTFIWLMNRDQDVDTLAPITLTEMSDHFLGTAIQLEDLQEKDQKFTSLFKLAEKSHDIIEKYMWAQRMHGVKAA